MNSDLLPTDELSRSERAWNAQQALYRSKGIEVDVFGVPVAEADRADHGDVRIVPITDEILAAEAAAEAARQTDREQLTWHRPEPLPASYYAARAKKKTSGRRAATPKPPRAAEAATPTAPPPAQVHKEEPPMEKHLEQKTCIVAGCNVALNANNKSGRCSEHGYLKKGTPLKDGTVTGEKPAAKKSTAKKGVSAAPPSLAKRGSTDKTIDAITGGAGVVLLPVPEQLLTDFWMRLDIADKVRIIAAELQRGM